MSNTVYNHSVGYASEHDELEIYRQSREADIKCRDTIERLVDENDYNNHFNCAKVVQEAVSDFGLYRVQFVLANTVRHKLLDGRISDVNKKWARTIPAPAEREHCSRILVYKTHSVLLNAMVDKLREIYSVYNHSFEYANEHGELDTFKKSREMDMSCRDAIERLAADNFHDNHFDGNKVLDEVLASFGLERVKFVLANTVQRMLWDGRISTGNKEWSETIPAPGEEKHSLMILIYRPHAILINDLVDKLRERCSE